MSSLLNVDRVRYFNTVSNSHTTVCRLWHVFLPMDCSVFCEYTLVMNNVSLLECHIMSQFAKVFTWLPSGFDQLIFSHANTTFMRIQFTVKKVCCWWLCCPYRMLLYLVVVVLIIIQTTKTSFPPSLRLMNIQGRRNQSGLSGQGRTTFWGFINYFFLMNYIPHATTL